LIGIGLFLSACAVEPEYGPPAYGYDGYADDPIYGSLFFDDGGWDGGHHGWDHRHEDHGGHGFAHHAGLGGHGGGGGHAGGGGHGGGGHR
jgi:hypothetical protein